MSEKELFGISEQLDDTISRAAALRIFEEHCYPVRYDHNSIDKGMTLPGIVEVLNMTPSAQQWIPCSKRMPEEHEWIGTKKFGTTISNEVYVTFETPDGERFAKHISFQNGKLSSVDEQHMKVWYKGAKPIAWKPLPEAWKGDKDEAE